MAAGGGHGTGRSESVWAGDVWRRRMRQCIEEEEDKLREALVLVCIRDM
jgi:hypothetical protein